MAVNRFARFFEEESVGSVPQPRSQTRSLVGFAVCPAALLAAPWQAQIYQAAYEQARAAVEAESARPAFKLCWN